MAETFLGEATEPTEREEERGRKVTVLSLSSKKIVEKRKYVISKGRRLQSSAHHWVISPPNELPDNGNR